MKGKAPLRVGLLVVLGMVTLGAAWLAVGTLTSRAVQNPTIKMDMVATGNTYSDPGMGGTNSMTVGTVESSSTGGNPATHTHSVQLIVQNVEDLVGWQARANYIGDRMRCSIINLTPFNDTTAGQAIGFANLPIDQVSGIHHTVTTAGGSCPAAPADNTNTPQTHLFGATYNGGVEGDVNFAISPDTPAKSPADDTSYSTTGG